MKFLRLSFRVSGVPCRNLLVVLLVWASAIAYATPPGFLYRVDTRPPDGENGIFRTGFLSWGNNRDLTAHQMGLSCGTGSTVAAATADSAYVSVSSSQERAREFAERSFIHPRPNVWLYTIRATPQFYDVAATVANAINNPDHTIRENAIQVDYFQGAAIEAEGEYVSTGAIDRSLVREAVMYRWDGSNHRYEQVPRTINNIHYVPDPESRANPNPMDPQVAFAIEIEPARVNRYVSIGLSIFGACACMSKSGASQIRSDVRRDDNAYCLPTLQDRNASSMLNFHLFY